MVRVVSSTLASPHCAVLALLNEEPLRRMIEGWKENNYEFLALNSLLPKKTVWKWKKNLRKPIKFLYTTHHALRVLDRSSVSLCWVSRLLWCDGMTDGPEKLWNILRFKTSALVCCTRLLPSTRKYIFWPFLRLCRSEFLDRIICWVCGAEQGERRREILLLCFLMAKGP